MRRFILLGALFIGGAFAGSECLGGLAGHPAPAFGLTLANTNVSSYVGITSSPTVRWQVLHTSRGPNRGALVLDHRGYLFAEGLNPLNSATGLPAGINLPVSARDSTPALDSVGNIYQWEYGRMHSYGPDGAPRWVGPTTSFSDGSGVKVGADGTVYGRGGDGRIYAFSSQGALLWSEHGGHSAGVPPTIDAQGNLYTYGDGPFGRYRSISSAGQPRWSVPASLPWNITHPMIGPDGNVYVAEDYGTRVSVRRPNDGSLVRTQSNLYGGIRAISQDGRMYSSSYQTIRATDLFGALVWERTVPADVFLGDLVVDAAGNVFCTAGSRMFAYSATGAPLWSLSLPGAEGQTLPPIIGPDGAIYVQSGDWITAIIPAPSALPALALTGLVAWGRRRRRG